MKNNVSLIYNVCLVMGDFLVLIAAFIVAYFVRVKFNVGINPADIGPSNGRAFLGVFLSIVPFWIIIFAFLGLYNSSIYEKRFQEFGRLLIGSFIGMLIAIFWDFLSEKPVFPARLVPIYGLGFAFVFLVLFRNLVRFVRVVLFNFDIGLTRVLLVGNTAMTHELATWLDSRGSGYKVVGVIGGKRFGGSHTIPTFATFNQFLQSKPVELHGIIQTELYATESRNAEILTYAQENHIGYRFVPGNTELFVGNIEVELFRSSIPVITVHQTALFGWGRVVKRLFDLVVGSILLVITSPVMLLVAIGVKLSDPAGPVFMHGKQRGRLTRFNNVFQLYKFRSHYAKFDGKTDEEVFAMIGKPELIEEYRKNGDRLTSDFRVHPFGKFIRKTSLDELPQLINVVKGDLSLVGPRALVPHELSQYAKKHAILSVKSGVTGLAVVSGRRNISFEERRALDLYYVQNWSFWLDLVILLKTVRVLLDIRGN